VFIFLGSNFTPVATKLTKKKKCNNNKARKPQKGEKRRDMGREEMKKEETTRGAGSFRFLFSSV